MKDLRHGSATSNVAGKSQLIAYHFMFALDWDAGCPSRSFIGLTNRFGGMP
jgi:predicted dithiol-disulfide oxidoreductase (DUF899 family)